MAMADIRGASDARTLLWMTGILVAATGVAISPVQDGELALVLLDVPGYTASLALSGFPLVPLGYWLYRRRKALAVEWRAFLYVAAGVVTFWTLLDVFLAHSFFRFPNPEATLGIKFLGWHGGLDFRWDLPVEELAFYAFACLTMVLLYAWSSERWFDRYSRSAEDYRRHGASCVRYSVRRALVLHRRILVLVGLLFGALCAFKKWGPHDYHAGFPWYALALIVGLLVPNTLLYPAISAFINRQAMLFTMTVAVLISLIWEVTLGLPNGWWGYQERAMVGIFVTPWSRLPIEAAFLWLMAGWGNVVLYEFLRLKIYSGRPWRDLISSRGPSHGCPPAAQGGPEQHA